MIARWSAVSGASATPADLGENVKSALIEGVQDQINGVGVKREAGGDFNGVPALSVEEKHLSSAALGSGQIIGFKALKETTNLGRVGSASWSKCEAWRNLQAKKEDDVPLF